MKPIVKLTLTALAIGAIAGTGMVLADRGYHEEREHWYERMRPPSYTPPQFYIEECGSCHFPYQAHLLPAQSWERIMSNLEDHFGENAELSDEQNARISGYLLNQAAPIDRLALRRYGSRSAQDGVPLRITETYFFRHEHDELPRRLVQDNPQVRSFSNCDTCHTDALRGSFSEHRIQIPGVGRWDD